MWQVASICCCISWNGSNVSANQQNWVRHEQRAICAEAFRSKFGSHSLDKYCTHQFHNEPSYAHIKPSQNPIRFRYTRLITKTRFPAECWTPVVNQFSVSNQGARSCSTLYAADMKMHTNAPKVQINAVDFTVHAIEYNSIFPATGNEH